MLHRRLASHLSVLIVGVCVGIGGVAVADRGPVAHSADTVAEIKLRSEVIRLHTQLLRLERTAGLTNRMLGGSDRRVPYGPSIQELLLAICQNTGGDFAKCEQ